MTTSFLIDLDLPHVEIDSVKIDQDGNYSIRVHSILIGGHCHQCGQPITKFHGYDREIKIKHLPIFGRETYLGRDLEDQPPQAALVANLQHPEYIRVVCDSLDNLATTFAELDEQAFEQTTPLSRNNRDSALFRRVRVLVKNDDKGKLSNDERDTIGAVATEL